MHKMTGAIVFFFILPCPQYNIHSNKYLFKVILWCILSYLNRISLWEEYPLMLNVNQHVIQQYINSGVETPYKELQC